jgi:hypothetical protein
MLPNRGRPAPAPPSCARAGALETSLKSPRPLRLCVCFFPDGTRMAKKKSAPATVDSLRIVSKLEG